MLHILRYIPHEGLESFPLVFVAALLYLILPSPSSSLSRAVLIAPQFMVLDNSAFLCQN